MLGIRRHSREQELSEALAASLDALRAGAASMDDCVRRYANLSADLAPLLQTSARIEAAATVVPAEDVRQSARYAFLQEAARQTRTRAVQPRRAVRGRAWLSLMPAVVATLLFAVIAIPVMGSVDTGSIPGDWNYGFKRATERVRLALTTDPADRRVLRLEFARRRLNEIERLSSRGQVDAHQPEVAALARSYTADLQQVRDDVQSAGAIPDSAKQQIAVVTTRAQALLPAVAQSAAADTPLSAAVQDALKETAQTDTTAKALPTPAPSHLPISLTATRAANATTAPSAVVSSPAITPPPTTESATPPATPSAISAPAPPPTVTPGTGNSPTPVATRSAPTIAATLATPSATAAGTATRAAPTQAVSADNTPGPDTPVPVGAGTVSPAVATTIPAPPPSTSPPAVGTIGGTPAPGRTPTALAPTAVGTRSATVIPAGTNSASLTTGQNVWKYLGPATTLDQVIASIAPQLVLVYYVGDDQTTKTWYPNTPPPTVPSGTVMTLVMRGPALLNAPGTLLSQSR